MLGLDKDGKVKKRGDDFEPIVDETIGGLKEATAKQNTIVLKQLNLYGRQVVDKMIKENIPPTPANYAIYFEKLLEDKPLNQKQNINTVLEMEKVEDFDYVLKIENNIHTGFTQVKEMMDSISVVYSKINKLRNITKLKKDELAKGTTSKLSLISYDEDLRAISDVLTSQQKTLKEKYNSVATVVKSFNNESIFDKKYDVYNKNYLLKAIDSEKSNIENFGSEGVLLALRVKKSALDNIRLTRDKELIIKTVGKMILKRSRRSDIVTHFDDGVFMLILKHTNAQQAEKTIESIEHMISFSNYIVDSETIDIKLDFALSNIDPQKTKEQIIATALDGFPS